MNDPLLTFESFKKPNKAAALRKMPLSEFTTDVYRIMGFAVTKGSKVMD